MKMDVEKFLEKAKSLGNKSGDSPEVIKKISRKLDFMNRGPVKKIWDKVLFLWEKAKSPEIPLKLKLTIIGALLYLILPVDCIPDAIPGIGLIDDVSVLMLVFKEVSEFSFPKIVQKANEKIFETCYKKIDEKLKALFLGNLRTVLINLFINLCVMLLLQFRPFGDSASKIAALCIAVLVFLWTFVRIVKYVKKYGATTIKISRFVVKNRSFSKGVSFYVQSEYSFIAKIYAGVDIVQKFVPGLDLIPDLDQIVKSFVRHYRFKILLYVLFVASYTLFFWWLKTISWS